jgi:hypothetical protein
VVSSVQVGVSNQTLPEHLIPTGEQITWQIAAIERYDTNGLIVEEWTEGDLTTVAIELGLIPPLDE